MGANMKPSNLDLPLQTPLYYALNKDRYSRQKLIETIQTATGRTLFAYIANSNHPAGAITKSDIEPFADLLENKEDIDLDLLIHSPGGDIDAAEKLVFMCREKSKSFRVIVPASAKSAATLIALAADSIVMGYTSELGPIDPQLVTITHEGNVISRPASSFLDGLDKIKKEAEDTGKLSPVYYVLLKQLDPALLDWCDKAIKRSKEFAKKWLRYKDRYSETLATEIADKLSDVNRYLSHGAIIDYKEAKDMKLKVNYLAPNNNLWKALWRLYCIYQTDIRNQKRAKI